MPGRLEPAENDIKGKSGEEGFSMAKKAAAPALPPKVEQTSNHSHAAKPPRFIPSESKKQETAEKEKISP